MTSEKELRRIAHAEVTMLVRNPHHKEPLWEDHPELTEGEWESVLELIDDWPIPDLPLADREGCWWPTHGRKYGHVRKLQGTIVIARGGLGVASRLTSLYLTADEAEELGDFLLSGARDLRSRDA
ncbi:hypothetical protein [Corynebacterium glyciniphilum]|uniref:hypothetical protein n=1 Tax=Corynebacterium glyciniphilum TaxID=1404244 RepID=UPI0011AB6B1C|nr:hypothetical protein [Corynebacterium glyciniphilum]